MWINYSVFIINDEDFDIIISGVSVSCRCLKAKIDKTTIHPMEKAKLDMVFLNNSSSFPLPQSVYVYFSNPKKLMRVRLVGKEERRYIKR